MSCPRGVAALSVILLVTGCGRLSPAPPDIQLTSAGSVDVVGLPADDLQALSRASFSADRWHALLAVSVEGETTPIVGGYAVANGALRFTPAFPFDAGRSYTVRFDPAQLPRSSRTEPWRVRPLSATVARPATPAATATVVAHVYPSGDELPENLLRFYIMFSGPMGPRGGVQHVHLLDERGGEIANVFLPLDAEFWNPGRTRYTLFLDPGRQKSGLLPREQLGPSLVAGHRYTLAIDREWTDAAGQPLREPFRRDFRVGPPDTRPIDPASWRIDVPAPATRDALAVSFPTPLDHGLLMRSLAVVSTPGRRPVAGEARIDADETRWTLVPREPWRPGPYQLVVSSVLEDRAGNQIGKPFEVDRFQQADRTTEPAIVRRPFRVGP